MMTEPSGTQRDASSGGLYQPVACRVDAISDLSPAERQFRLTRTDGKPGSPST